MSISLGTDGYCTLAHLQALNGQRAYTTETTPTDSEAEGFITDVFDEINGVLDALGYVVPVPTSKAVASRILKTVNQYGAAAKCELATHSVGLEGENERAEQLKDQFDDLVAQIKSGELSLVDAERNDDSPKQVNEKTPAGSFNLDTDDVEREPEMSRDMDF